MIKKISSAIATLSLLFYSFAIPAFAQTVTLEVSGNGAGSENEVEVETTTETTVVQENNANIVNNIEAEAKTGDNEAEDNTGGDVSIETGDATTEVTVSNQANTNTADVSCSNCTGDISATVSGNGSNSENEIEVENEQNTEVYQNNTAYITNNIEAEAKTGDNEAEDNTGGDVSITTGNADTSVTVSNLANANVASVGGGGTQGALSAWITGNGSDSENEIELDLDRSVLLVQENRADIRNYIEAEAETGDNEAEDNTGGDVSIDTGDATTTVDVNNEANFNWADVECCLFDILAKISGNGSDSENEIEAEIENTLELFQENCGKDHVESLFNSNNRHNCGIENDIEAEAETGDNDPDGNTGPAVLDPVEVTTGNAESTVEVNNSTGANIFSQGNATLQDGLNSLFEGLNLDFNFSFNLEALLALLQSQLAG
ncbi:hypothetical protein HY383_02320 [Candidatus Daviesbacteria bacterium]|nr:hypothetical protein [Candidatus Daviesbacteria bacterium]